MTISAQMLYNLLLDHFGYQHWWPIDTTYHQTQKSDPRFEIIVGAILTQNTAWTNVEKALENLKRANVLTVDAMRAIDEEGLKTLIQPSGFFNQKARRLKLFASYIHANYEGDLSKFFSQDTLALRHELLSIKGIGPETADSIALYAGNHPVFVVDAYTKRISRRVPLLGTNDAYDAIQRFFESELHHTIPKKKLVQLYKEYHALLVACAKQYCWKQKPHCDCCPLTRLCKKTL
jgi:endonuclease-3 related protein